MTSISDHLICLRDELNLVLTLQPYNWADFQLCSPYITRKNPYRLLKIGMQIAIGLP